MEETKQIQRQRHQTQTSQANATTNASNATVALILQNQQIKQIKPQIMEEIKIRDSLTKQIHHQTHQTRLIKLMQFLMRQTQRIIVALILQTQQIKRMKPQKSKSKSETL